MKLPSDEITITDYKNLIQSIAERERDNFVENDGSFLLHLFIILSNEVSIIGYFGATDKIKRGSIVEALIINRVAFDACYYISILQQRGGKKISILGKQALEKFERLYWRLLNEIYPQIEVAVLGNRFDLYREEFYKLVPTDTIIPNLLLYHLYTEPLLSENNYQGIWLIDPQEYFRFLITQASLCKKLNANLKEYFKIDEIPSKRDYENIEREPFDKKLQNFEKKTGIAFSDLITVDNEIAFKKGGIITPIIRLKTRGSKKYYNTLNRMAVEEFETGNYEPRRPAEDYLDFYPKRIDENGSLTGFVDEDYLQWEVEYIDKVKTPKEKGVPESELPITKYAFLEWVKSRQEYYQQSFPYLKQHYTMCFPSFKENFAIKNRNGYFKKLREISFVVDLRMLHPEEFNAEMKAYKEYIDNPTPNANKKIEWSIYNNPFYLLNEIYELSPNAMDNPNQIPFFFKRINGCYYDNSGQ